MPAANSKPGTVDEYLARVKPEQRATLEKLRQTIHDAAPDVEECISYGLASFKLHQQPLIYFGAWANHCAFYPGAATLTKLFQRELKHFRTGKGTIRFTPEQPLPAALVRKLVKARIAGNKHKFTKHKTK